MALKRLAKQEPQEMVPANDGNFLAALLGAPAPTTSIEPATGGGFVPYISFYSGREGNRGGSLTAREIADCVPGISVGSPYLRSSDEIRRADVPLVLVDLFTFYGERDDDNKWCDAAPAARDALKPAALALFLVVDGQTVTPAICETIGKAKSSALFKLGNGTRKPVRISGAAKSFDTEENGKKRRIEYTQTYARDVPLDVAADVAQALTAWGSDPANETLVEAAREEFNRRKSDVEALF